MMRRDWRLLLATALLLEASGAAAQAPPPDPATACELHVFPTTEVGSQTQGIMTGGLLRRKADATDSSALLNAIDADTQGRILSAAEFTSRLGLSGKVVVEAPLTKEQARQRGRRSSSSAACYYEIEVTFIFVDKTWMYNNIHIDLDLIDFAATSRPRHYRRTMPEPLKLFPPKPGEDLLAANDEVVAAFRTAMGKFADAGRAWLSKAATQ